MTYHLPSPHCIQQRFDHRLHHRRAYGISDHADTITARSAIKNEAFRKPHGPLQLGDLEHSKSCSPTNSGDQTKAIESGERSKGPVKRLPPASGIRTIIHNYEVFVPAKPLPSAPDFARSWPRQVGAIGYTRASRRKFREDQGPQPLCAGLGLRSEFRPAASVPDKPTETCADARAVRQNAAHQE